MSLRYILYVRKSSEPEDRQMSSIEDQVVEMKRIAAEFNLHIIDIVSESMSAKRPGRAGFNSMLARIQKGEADAILCWKLNRLARNPVDGGQISWLLQQRIIKHIQTYGRAYTPDDNVLMMQVEFGIANQFIKDLKGDVERGMKRKAERGWYPTRPPMGYTAINYKNRQPAQDEIIPHPVQFPIVRRLWDLLLTNSYSFPALKREGDRLGLRKTDGTYYSLNTYQTFFRNIFYTGNFVWTPFNGIKTEYKGNHQPMVTWYEFQKAQEIMNKMGDVRQRVHMLPYRGIIICGECNGNVSAEHKLQAVCTTCKYKFSIVTIQQCPKCKTLLSEMTNPTILEFIYYRCTKKTTPTCSQKHTRKEVIEEAILRACEAITISQEFYDFAKPILMGESSKSEEPKDILILKKRLTELQNRLGGLIGMRADGDISKDQFEAMKTQANEEITSIRNSLQRYDRLESIVNSELTEKLDLMLNAISIFKNGTSEAKTRLLGSFGSNPVLKDKKLTITTDKVLNRLKECEVIYRTKTRPLEPKKTIIKPSVKSPYYQAKLVLCSKLRAIRTLLKKIKQDDIIDCYKDQTQGSS